MNLNYVLIRLFQSLLIIFIAVTINFVIPRMIPGDPIEAALSTKIAISGTVSVDVEEMAKIYRKKFGLLEKKHSFGVLVCFLYVFLCFCCHYSSNIP